MVVALRPLATENDACFAPIVDLYRTAFPANERKPASFLASAIQRDDYAVYAAMKDADAIGLAVTYHSPGGDFTLVEYMAVIAVERGAGLGSQLFQALAVQCPSPLLMEVESERPGVRGHVQRRRRIDFYRRLGCGIVAGVDYRMPRVGDGDAPPPMMLMMNGASPPSGARLRRWLIEIYANVYDRPADDSALRRMTDQIDGDIRLI